MSKYIITVLRTEKYIADAASIKDAEVQAKQLINDQTTLVSVVESLTERQEAV